MSMVSIILENVQYIYIMTIGMTIGKLLFIYTVHTV